ncbi:tetratricopeptide repeat protein [Nonomuraea sp. NPDC049714]|uniref:tetratricopeptide repeat protein n=1 Tax=Nonomuraea sp. NPDC049714 TaxID=3364357 RepID=UPI0037991271
MLSAGRADSALAAASAATHLDPASEWAYRLLSLAQERIGRLPDAVDSAERAVLLAPGSWAARLRLGAVLRHVPGRWDEAAEQAALAARFAPEEPDTHVLVADLDLLRAEHAEAARGYRQALRLDPLHPQAHVNLGLTLLRWERFRTHHDPAWPIDPRETGWARRALEVWSRQTRLLVAVATAAIAVAALVFDRGPQAELGGLAVLALLAALTVRQARRVRVWAWVPAMLGRDPWFGAAVAGGVVAVVAFAGWLALASAPAGIAVLPGLPAGGLPWAGLLWAGLGGLAVLGWPALAAVRALAETWRGHPLRALTHFHQAAAERTTPGDEGERPGGLSPGGRADLGDTAERPVAVRRRLDGSLDVGAGERAGRRNAGVTLWVLLGRTWSVLVPLGCAALAVEPRAAVVTLAAPYPMLRAWRATRHGRDRWLAVAGGLTVLAAVGCAAGGGLGLVWGWRMGFGALGAVAAVFALRTARSWWKGVPGPWRASLIMCELPMGAEPTVVLTSQARQAFGYARTVVLAYGDALGPRVVGAVATVTASGELKVIAGPQAWEAIEADPSVSVFAADPLQRRHWVEVRGVALAGSDVLRVTPKKVLVGEFPGRHQRR